MTAAAEVVVCARIAGPNLTIANVYYIAIFYALTNNMSLDYLA